VGHSETPWTLMGSIRICPSAITTLRYSTVVSSKSHLCQGMLYAFLYSVCRATRTLRSSLSSTVRVPDSPFHLSSSVVSLPFVYIASRLPSLPLLYSISSTHCPWLCSNRLCSLVYKYFVRWALTAHLDITLIPRSNALALLLSSHALTGLTNLSAT
jgi:hypothetical protein